MQGGELRQEEQPLFRTRVCGSRWGLRPRDRGGFLPAFPPVPPSSGATGAAHEPRSGRPDSTHTLWPTRMICTLERRERVAHCGDSDIVIFMFNRSDRPCLSLYYLYYVVTANGEG
jgi:hypothetical protein